MPPMPPMWPIRAASSVMNAIGQQRFKGWPFWRPPSAFGIQRLLQEVYFNHQSHQRCFTLP